jgi:hypothetical protein
VVHFKADRWEIILPECHWCMVKVGVMPLPSSDVHRAVQRMFHMLLWYVPSLLLHTCADGRWWTKEVTGFKRQFANSNNHTHFDVTLVWLTFLFFWDMLLCHWAVSSWHFNSTTVLQNIGNQIPTDPAWYPRKAESLVIATFFHNHYPTFHTIRKAESLVIATSFPNHSPIFHTEKRNPQL